MEAMFSWRLVVAVEGGVLPDCTAAYRRTAARSGAL